MNKFFSKVVVVENAKQALETLKEKEIDIVLTDIRMPKVDGLQLMSKIRRLHPDIPILLISGEPISEEQEVNLKNADGFLPKPFSVDQLNDFIHFGADLRQVLKELSTFLKDPKKVREAFTAKDQGFAKFVQEDKR
ncbi:MAG: response regulator, partial [Proteobacteria bacterium]|nr:response regulator [Pseudomonadota bacterium]